MFSGGMKMSFKDLGVRWKVLVLSGFLGFCLVIVGGTGWFITEKLLGELEGIQNNELKQARFVNAARTYTRGIEGNMLEFLLSADNSKKAKILAETEEYAGTLKKIWKELDSIDYDEKEQMIYKKARDEIATATQYRLEAIRLYQQGDKDKAWQIYFEKAQPHIDAGNKLFNQLSQSADDSAVKAEERSKDLAKTGRALLAVIIVSSILIGLIVSVWLSGKISKALQILEERANAVADGDLSGNVLAVQGHDEIGRLTYAFNTMQKKLKVLVSETLQTADHVAAAAEELTANGDQCALAAQQITGSVMTVAGEAESQQGHVEQTSAAVEQISASTQEVAATVDSLAKNAEGAVKTAHGGEIKVNEAVVAIAKVEAGAEEVNSVMNELEEGSSKIFEIVAVIKSIADQTNLLALNAAIEAARAGEAGRGFAVVADEVRKLAEDSAKAADHIGELINSNKKSMEVAIGTTREVGEALLGGSKLVKEAGDSFGEILEIVDELAKEMKEISIAVDETAKGTQDIVNSAAEIDKGTREINCEIQQVSAAMEEQSASMEEVASAGRALAQLSEELLNRVKAFRL